VGPDPVFGKVLVANRGEIAVRVFRTLRELGIECVAVYSEADRGSLHVRVADEAHLLGPGPPGDSYLNVERVLDAARRAGANAVHPGYGFLAENAAFARACEEAEIVWIGPPPDAIEAMGSKVEARRVMSRAGVPVVPGSVDPVETAEELVRLGDEYGWPVAVKASAGGGGKGLKVVASAAEAERALASARREGEAYFSDATVYVEKLIVDPRHVEVQVLADAHGNAIHLGERDCTIQRRHQKIVEETPSPAVGPELRERIGRIALEAARAVGYRGAGTIEGLLDREGNYYFLEMNTRIQVEHTITELVTGVDLVREQVRVAAGMPLSLAQDDVRFHGHAIECRVNAEDAANEFLPAPGRITAYREPAGPGVRVDSGVEAGSEVVGLYDPLIAKLCVWDVDRESARRRMLRALEEYVVEGPVTLIGYHRALLAHPCFVDATTCHGVVESQELAKSSKQFSHEATNVAQGSDGAGSARVRAVEVDGRRYTVTLFEPEPPYRELARRRRARAGGGPGTGHAAAKEAVVSPMQGTVLAVEVEEGEQVEPGRVVCIVEAMKMENEIKAHRRGAVTGLSVRSGDAVKSGQVICVVASGGDGEEPAPDGEEPAPEEYARHTA
jgi:acetyl-CoA/propionyl-CoA carboxylase, biotin carboxylase, biotin carboxyl carrier protein